MVVNTNCGQFSPDDPQCSRLARERESVCVRACMQNQLDFRGKHGGHHAIEEDGWNKTRYLP